MTKDEALKMAIEAMTYHIEQTRSIASTCIAIQACKEALEQPAQEHSMTYEDGFTHGYDAHLADYKEQPTQEPLYTTPPSREWQSLSDDDISYTWAGFAPDAIDFARAIEQALKEKNSK
jgi:20S proteasome alpha/beta subunit